MTISEAIKTLEQGVPDPSTGLPDEVFFYISKTTPLVNVDLLIKDEQGRTLLAWRNDEYSGTGWHVPGGIVRFKETLESRVREVAQAEVGATVAFDPAPMAVKQCIHREREIRGHFVSILYNCRLPSSFVPDNKGRAPGQPGFLRWHEACPPDLLQVHEMYREHITARATEALK